jgi:formylglycine-generating enzyme required for sulfatase activity
VYTRDVSVRSSVGVLALVALAACGKSSSTQATTPTASTAPPDSAAAPPEAGVDDAGADAAAGAGPDAGADAETADAPESGPPDMLLVPGGKFTMGADQGGEEDEHPAHEVTLAAFWLDKTEVTNAAYDACVQAHACRAKSDAVRTKHPDFDGPNQPVSGISWDDASGYCKWRGKRLPREAEFEKAVRDTDDRRFAWGNDPPTHDKTVFGGSRPEDVGTHPAGRGPYGHDDLAGNVWEWMADEYDPYAYRRPTAAQGQPGTCPEIMSALDELRRDHRQGFTGSNPIPDECEHSIRGGAYNFDPKGLRATNRVHHPGRFRIPMLGFRCAK